MKHNWYIVCSIPRVLGWSWINTHYGSNPFQIPRRWHVLSPPQICPIPAEQCNAWSLDESVQSSFHCRVQHLTRIDWFLISKLRVLVDIYKEKYKINLKAKQKKSFWYRVYMNINFLLRLLELFLKDKGLNTCRIPLGGFVCLEFFVPLDNFSLIWRRHHSRWGAANFDLYMLGKYGHWALGVL